MGITTSLVNRLIMLLYKKSATEFKKDFKRVDEIQKSILLNILKENQNTIYGEKHSFSLINSAQEYAKKVPLTNYKDYKEYINNIALGSKNVLTKEDVNMFEITGGSGGAVKLIPYTKGLKAEFLQGIKPWIYELYSSNKKVKNGKSYWSITPPSFKKTYTEGGIPIGFEDDTAYFGKIEQFLTDFVFVRDKSVLKEKDMDKFYFKTCLCLLKEKNLSLISVWNPSYLLILLNFIEENKIQLIKALSSKRKSEIQQFIHNKQYTKIWPNLALISCWCDGLAESASKDIKKLFPSVQVQPKGILATEAFMSLPYKNSKYSILSYKSHYFEFINTSTKQLCTYSQLKKNTQYEIVFTTSGGFYRYKINDAVMVMDYSEEGLPLLKFVGKTDKTSDYHGEKLNELFLKEIIDKISLQYKELDINNKFKLFAYENSHYVLFLQAYENPSLVKSLESFTEQLLCESYHYNLCRDLKQLQPIEIKLISGEPKQVYLDFYIKKGKKLGDIKPELLSLYTGWGEVFEIYNNN